MMHSMFPIIPLATDPGDLRPVESLALTTPLVVAIVACLLLAVGLIALIDHAVSPRTQTSEQRPRAWRS